MKRKAVAELLGVKKNVCCGAVSNLAMNEANGMNELKGKNGMRVMNDSLLRNELQSFFSIMMEQ